ncbi:hypothetical protein BOTBODRAFT_152248 [Botryobasidium botryosum FD-172 SS1]|uniref:S1/P1 nuclease n=1 Tax=Botryobasidium botryosum (strain FD-172 SS1) TaxID=930990 RepID=A0A067N6K8_BOTB1|nr:hypothetical protein BOTBODRAFT_152248 [Botryobasidium botryosum FD-172 SS1]
MRFPSVAIVLPFAGSALAWGALGHRTIGAIAQNYLTPATTQWVTSLLGSATLLDVSTWADDYRSTAAGTFSAPFHYIDALDSPPSTCNVNYSRDCGSTGCIVSAITNYTSRAQSTSLSTAQKTDALKFLVHFLGDITQPLHDENIEKGGNGITVLWNGKSTNLHSVWDTAIPEKYVGGNTATYANNWAKEIIAKLSTGGAYASSLSSWISCTNPSTAQSCAVSWATDGNALICTNVLKTNPAGQELSGAYYNAAIPEVERQIAKGGVRLAAYLNTIATGKASILEEEDGGFEPITAPSEEN